jgi:hypothetical protein
MSIAKVVQQQLHKEIERDNGIDFITSADLGRLPNGWTVDMMQALASGYSNCDDQELIIAAKKYLKNAMIPMHHSVKIKR